MKYFTPDLLERIGATDDDVADAAHAEWERAVVRSNRRWKKIKDAFPEAVRCFDRENICLHDARLLSMGRKEATFVMVLETEPPARHMIILTFLLENEPLIDPAALTSDSTGIEWLYEEWDLDSGNKCCFEVLFSNGWSVKLCFRDFQYQVVEKVCLAENVQASGSGATMTRSA